MHVRELLLFACNDGPLFMRLEQTCCPENDAALISVFRQFEIWCRQITKACCAPALGLIRRSIDLDFYLVSVRIAHPNGQPFTLGAVVYLCL